METYEDLENQIDWEGGIIQFIEYGVTDLGGYDVDHDLRTRFSALAEKLKPLLEEAESLTRLIEERAEVLREEREDEEEDEEDDDN